MIWGWRWAGQPERVIPGASPWVSSRAIHEPERPCPVQIPYVASRQADQREIILASLDLKVEHVFDRFTAIAFGDPAAITECP